MKRINILMALLICAYSLVGCRKEANIGTTNDTIINTTDSPYASVISYVLTSPPPGPGSLIQWNYGYISTKSLIFNVTHQIGNAMGQNSFETNIWQTTTLTPQLHTSFLGSLKVPGMQCPHASFTLGLSSPAAGGAAIAPPNVSFLFNGTYTNAIDLPPMLIPVRIVINDPVKLNTVWLNNIMIGQMSYIVVIELDLNKLTNGITTNMMNKAVTTNGTIFITASSNKNLYGIIVNNLQDNMMNVLFVAKLLNTAPFPTE